MDIQTQWIDMKFALQQLSGNLTLLKKMFGKFTSEYKDAVEKLKHSINTNDLSESLHLVHTVKGVTGNLGIKPLHMASKELEQALKDGSDHTAQLNHFEQTLQATLKELDAICKTVEETPTTSSTNDTSQTDEQARAELLTALKRNEFLTENKLQLFTDRMNLSQEEKMQLADAVYNLDYATAIAQLEA